MKKEEQDEFEILLEIDRYRLDDESAAQPRKVWHYSKMLAVALLKLDEAKANVKVVEAEVDAIIRMAPTKFGLAKPTELALKKATYRSRKMKTALKKLHRAQYRVNLVEGANKALDHRRTSLTILNSQDERGYYSKPRESKQRNRVSKHRKTLKKKRKE
jgi:hypothetical protein